MIIIISIILLLIISILILYPMYTDLSEASDLALRYLAKLDANLERRLDAITIILGIVRDEMKQDLTLVKEIEAVRENIKTTKKRWNNAAERFSMQKTLEEQMTYLYKSMRNYPNLLRANTNLRKVIEDLSTLEKYVLIDAYNYNDHIKKFSGLVHNFPSCFIAQALEVDCKFAPYPMLTKEQKEAQAKDYTPQSSKTSTENSQPQAHYFEDENDPGSFFSK